MKLLQIGNEIFNPYDVVRIEYLVDSLDATGQPCVVSRQIHFADGKTLSLRSEEYAKLLAHLQGCITPICGEGK